MACRLRRRFWLQLQLLLQPQPLLRRQVLAPTPLQLSCGSESWVSSCCHANFSVVLGVCNDCLSYIVKFPIVYKCWNFYSPFMHLKSVHILIKFFKRTNNYVNLIGQEIFLFMRVNLSISYSTLRRSHNFQHAVFRCRQPLSRRRISQIPRPGVFCHPRHGWLITALSPSSLPQHDYYEVCPSTSAKST